MKTSADTSSRAGRWVCPHLIFLLLVVFTAACGRAGDPIPPLRRSLENTQLLEVFQRGDRVLVRWPRPNLTNPLGSGVSRVDIYRLEEPTTAPRGIREEIFLEQAQIIGFLKPDQIAAIQAPVLTFEDPLDLNHTSWKTSRFRYAVRYTDAHNQLAPLSNYAMVMPSPNVPERPTEPAVTYNQDAVTLVWKAPEKKIDGSPLAATVSYNVYRRGTKGDFGKRPLNPAPLTEPRFADTKFRFKVDFVYVVRSVTDVRGEMVESLDSDPVAVTPIDTFKPLAPQNVTGASAAGLVSLFWPTSPENDIKGYVIYRAEKSDNPTWTRLTPSPMTATTFRDATGEKGKTYLYQITAVDVFDNESARSETVTVEVVN